MDSDKGTVPVTVTVLLGRVPLCKANRPQRASTSRGRWAEKNSDRDAQTLNQVTT